MARPRSPLPLRDWMVVFGIVLSVRLAVVLWYTVTAPAYETPTLEDFRIDRLEVPSHPPRVVVVGTSLVRHALPFDDELGRKAKETGIDARFVRITKDAGTAEEYAPLLPWLLERRPDVVFLQAEPLAIDFNQSRGDRAFRRGIRLIGSLAQGTEQRMHERWRRENSGLLPPATRNRPQNNPELFLSRLSGRLARYVLKPTLLPEPYGAFLESARAANIRVVLLEIGRSREANALLPDAFHRQVAERYGQITAGYGVEVWRFPANLTSDHYTDHAHLDASGRAVFVDWFLGRLATILPRP